MCVFFVDFPIWWQASISLLDTFTSTLSKISVTFSSRFWSLISSGIPLISRIFLRPYRSKELLFSSSEIAFFWRLFILLRGLWFTTCKSFIITFFKFSISLSRLSKRNNDLLSRFMISSDVSEVLLSFEANEFCLVL